MQLWPQNRLTKLSPISASSEQWAVSSELASSDKKRPKYGPSAALTHKMPAGLNILVVRIYLGGYFKGVRRLVGEIRSKMPVTGFAAPTCYQHNEHNGHMHYLRGQRPTIVLCSASLPCHLNSSSRELKNHIESYHMQATVSAIPTTRALTALSLMWQNKKFST